MGCEQGRDEEKPDRGFAHVKPFVEEIRKKRGQQEAAPDRVDGEERGDPHEH